MGKIKDVTSDRFTAEVYGSYGSGSPGVVPFRRADILRVSAGRIYYSGRSSWWDVSSLHLKGRDRLKIVTTAGKTYNVTPPFTVSDDGITLRTSGKPPTKVAKSDIAQIYSIVAKPLTDSGEYLNEELGPLIVFDPDLWVYGLHLEQYVAVLLYNAGDPEDNSPANCEKIPAARTNQ